MIRIAIIGMGASGTTAAIFLLQKLRADNSEKQFEIICFEEKNEIGRGLAYSTPKDFHILNMTSKTMSLYGDKPDDFYDWLKADANRQVENWEYVPRHLFGSYLHERFEQAKAAADARVKINVISEEVIDCQEIADGVIVRTNSSEFKCDEAVICLGHVPRRQTTSFFPNNRQYIGDPWDFVRFEKIEKSATVGILGSGLTAVDIILTLVNNGTQGKIFCFARKRQLPKVKEVRKPVSLKHLTYESFLKLSENRKKPISIETVINLLEKDFNEFPDGAKLWQQFYWDPPLDTSMALAEALADESTDKASWHTILDATSELVPFLWNQMSLEDQQYFRVSLEQKWHMFRHSMPKHNAKKIYKIIQEGKLRILTGDLKIDFDEAKKKFHIVTKSVINPELPAEENFVDYLLDSRSSATSNIDSADSSLLQNMKARGQIAANPMGGVDVDFDTSKIKFADGETSEHIRMIGELTRGVYFYTNSYDMNRNSAKTVVDDLAKKYQGEAC